MKPLVTVGLPVYNDAPYVQEALRSIFAQTFSDWELIAVDDGSADGSADILSHVRDPRVHALVDGEHRGLGARLNQIVARAQGTYIARMDADDLMHPERIVRQAEFLEQHPEVDLAGCRLISFDAACRPVSVRQYPRQHGAITADPLRGFRLAHAAAMARTAWWKRHPYDENCRGCEDVELWFSTYRESRFENLPEPLYFYREEQAYSFGRYARDKVELARRLWSRRDLFGTPAAMASVAAQWVRIGVYAVARLAGADRTLVRRRGMPPTSGEAREFMAALERIRATALPLG